MALGKRWREEDTLGLWLGAPGSGAPLTDGFNRGSEGGHPRAQGPGRGAISFSATCAGTGASQAGLPDSVTRFLRSLTQRPCPGTCSVSVYRLKINPQSVPGPLPILPFKGSQRATPGGSLRKRRPRSGLGGSRTGLAPPPGLLPHCASRSRPGPAPPRPRRPGPAPFSPSPWLISGRRRYR